jgi:hypothetical protein
MHYRKSPFKQLYGDFFLYKVKGRPVHVYLTMVLKIQVKHRIGGTVNLCERMMWVV